MKGRVPINSVFPYYNAVVIFIHKPKLPVTHEDIDYEISVLIHAYLVWTTGHIYKNRTRAMYMYICIYENSATRKFPSIPYGFFKD